MRFFPTSFLGLIVSTCMLSVACAQYTYSSLERLGLQRNWSTMVNASPTGSGIAGVIVSANHDDRHTFAVHELQYDGGFKRFTPLDLGADGLPIGPDEALRLAEVEELRKKALNRNPVLTTKKIHPVDLFVSTNSGVLQSIDAETGRTHWSISVGSPNRPTSPPAANDWYVAVINGSQLFVVDRATGEPVLDRQLTTTPMVASSRSNMGPVMTNFGFETVNDAEVSVDWIYIPCTGGRLEAYSVANRATPPWFTTTRGNVSGRPVIGAGRVAWTSTNGYLQVADAQDHGLRFRLQTGEQIDASAAYLAPGKFFVGARNGYLYAIDETSENIDWEFSTAQPILDPPVAIEGDVIVTTQDRNMFCVDKDGNEKWMAPAIDSFLAASENRIYAVDDRGQLNVLSRKTGARLGPAVRLNSLPVVNTETDRVYVTSTLGQLYCFSELGSEFATIHHPKEVLERDRPFASKKSKSDTTEQPAAPVVDQDDVGDMEPDTIDNDTGDDFDFGAEEPDATTTDDQPAEDDGTDFGGEDDDNPFDFGDEF